ETAPAAMAAARAFPRRTWRIPGAWSCHGCVCRPSVPPTDRGMTERPPDSRSAGLSAAFSAHVRRRLRPYLYRESSNAGCVGNSQGRFRITHPFHPLRGTEYELVTRRLTWGEDRVFYYDQAGELRSFLSNVTDLIPEDAFSHVSGGRSSFRADDLLELRR